MSTSVASLLTGFIPFFQLVSGVFAFIKTASSDTSWRYILWLFALLNDYFCLLEIFTSIKSQSSVAVTEGLSDSLVPAVTVQNVCEGIMAVTHC